MSAEPVDLDEAQLTESSRLFASRLFQRLPELRSAARMVAGSESGGFDLLVEVPSPTGESNRQLVIWMDGGDEPSMGFGEWHTHASVESQVDDLSGDDAIIGLAEDVLADRFVLTYDVGGEHDGHWGVVDSREPDALLDQLTSRFSPGRVMIRTWSGSGDREVGLEDLTVD